MTEKNEYGDLLGEVVRKDLSPWGIFKLNSKT